MDHPAGGGGDLRCRLPAAVSPLRAFPVLFLHVLALLPLLAAAVFLPLQRIPSSGPSSYCGFLRIERYRTWCEGPISAFVASNSSCQQYGMCVPLEGDDAMTCSNKTDCSGAVPGGGGTRVAACLVLQGGPVAAAAGDDSGAVVLCDVEVQGASVLYSPPPSPSSTNGADGSGGDDSPDWALWKTMAIIWSILGFAALTVVVVSLIRCQLRRRAQYVGTSPVTILSQEQKKQIEQETHGSVQRSGGGAWEGGGGAHATVTLRPISPDGKQILAYGGSYPPSPPLLAPMIIPGPSSSRLPPSAGDALLQAAADSRAAYNGSPLREPPVTIPPSTGVALPPPSAVAAAAAAVAPAGGTLVPPGYGSPAPGAAEVLPLAAAAVGAAAPLAVEAATAAAAPDAAASPAAAAAAAAAGSEPPPGSAELAVIRPAALAPPPAATLRNPRGSSASG